MTIAQTTRLTVPQLRKGMIVHQHGGRFEVMEDARASTGHRPKGASLDEHGPTDCAVERSIYIEGEVQGYFKPGSDCTQQGNQLAIVYVETDSISN